jgi:type II secretory pathway component GspD/PulD (secretin)
VTNARADDERIVTCCPPVPQSTGVESKNKGSDYTIFKLRNIQSSIVAWWLDPLHNAMPMENGAKLDVVKIIGVAPKRPAGIESVIAIERQNALLVWGEEEAKAELSKTIALLDKPLPRIELEVGIVTMSDGALKPFDYPGSSWKTPTVLTGVTGIRGLIANAEATGIARTIAAPRYTLINNLPASLHCINYVATPITITPTSQKFKCNEQSSWMGPLHRLNVTPTMHDDSTVTLQLELPVPHDQPLKSDVTSSPANKADVARPPLNLLKMTVNATDGATVAIVMGLNYTREIPKIPILGRFFKSSRQIPPGRMLLLLTPRIIRPTDHTPSE